MTKVTWKIAGGREITANVAEGQNLMEAAVANNVHGVFGECGGNLSCATCHVYVAAEWMEQAGAPGDFEDAMLDATEAERQENSRLSCQLIASKEMDGIILQVPEI